MIAASVMKELIGLILEEKFADDPFRYSSPISGWCSLFNHPHLEISENNWCSEVLG